MISQEVHLINHFIQYYDGLDLIVYCLTKDTLLEIRLASFKVKVKIYYHLCFGLFDSSRCLIISSVMHCFVSKVGPYSLIYVGYGIDLVEHPLCFAFQVIILEEERYSYRDFLLRFACLLSDHQGCVHHFSTKIKTECSRISSLIFPQSSSSFSIVSYYLVVFVYFALQGHRLPFQALLVSS